MIRIEHPADFRTVGNLSFCYLCGEKFSHTSDERTDKDHVPPKSAFHNRDRDPPLKLKTHRHCHTKFNMSDTKVGQLISLRRGDLPKPKDRVLKVVAYPELQMTAIENLQVEDAVWRWVYGFHAALYRQPVDIHRAFLQTPLPRADKVDGRVVLRPFQLNVHQMFVEAIKRNRAFANLDGIVSNNGKLKYDCVWCQDDRGEIMFCVFAIDIYRWKDLGSDTPEIPARGCVGCYKVRNGGLPEGASVDRRTSVLIPSKDLLDPFS